MMGLQCPDGKFGPFNEIFGMKDFLGFCFLMTFYPNLYFLAKWVIFLNKLQYKQRPINAYACSP